MERSVWGEAVPMEMSSRQLNTCIWNIRKRLRSGCTFVNSPSIAGFEIHEVR